MGVGKLMLTLSVCILGIVGGVAKVAMSSESNSAKIVAVVVCILSCLASLGSIVWVITDWALVLAGKMNDADGYALIDDI